MVLRASTRPLSRRAAFFAALVALLASAAAGAAAPDAHAAKKRKAPVIKKVSPMDVAVGETLTIRGKHFRPGRLKNSVVFKRSGGRAIFAKAQIGTRKMLLITVPESLQSDLAATRANGARFRLRVLSERLGKKFTKKKRSPRISGKPSIALESGDCNGDGIVNSKTADDDADLLADTEEARIMTDACKSDTDGDGVEDGFEYQSAIDLNDDGYQRPNKILAYPKKMPYPNPAFVDSNTDYDGDSLTLAEEQALWRYTYTTGGTATRTLTPLSYSDGLQHSLSDFSGRNGRRAPTQPADTYPQAQQFIAWASENGYLEVDLQSARPFFDPKGGVVAPPPKVSITGVYDIRDTDLSGGYPEPDELGITDDNNSGYVSDDERDEDADGLSNYQEQHGWMLSSLWASCYAMEAAYPVTYAGTDLVDPDTDGDGVRDGADDQDHDDLPNMMELSRYRASGGASAAGVAPYEIKGIDDSEKFCTPDTDIASADADADGQPDVLELGNHKDRYGRVNPFNPCLPFKDSPTCSHFLSGGGHAPFDGSVDWWALN